MHIFSLVLFIAINVRTVPHNIQYSSKKWIDFPVPITHCKTIKC